MEETIFVCTKCKTERKVDGLSGKKERTFDGCPMCRKQFKYCKTCGFVVYFDPFKEEGYGYKCTACGRLN